MSRYRSSIFNIIVGAIVSIAFLFFSLYMLYASISAYDKSVFGYSYIELFGNHYTVSTERVDALIVASVLFMICSAVFILATIGLGMLRLDIYNDRIVGVGGTPIFGTIITKSFAMRYEDIMNVEVHCGAVILQTSTKTYSLKLKDGKQAVIELQQMINKHKA